MDYGGCISPTLANSCLLSLHIFFLAHPLFSFLCNSNYSCYIVYYCPRDLRCSDLFLSLCVSVSIISIDLFSSSLIFFYSMSNQLISLSNNFLFFFIMVFISTFFPFGSFEKRFSWLWNSFSVYLCLLLPLSFHTFIIIILKSLSNHSNIYSISGWICFCWWVIFPCFFMCVIIFCFVKLILPKRIVEIKVNYSKIQKREGSFYSQATRVEGWINLSWDCCCFSLIWFTTGFKQLEIKIKTLLSAELKI